MRTASPQASVRPAPSPRVAAPVAAPECPERIAAELAGGSGVARLAGGGRFSVHGLAPGAAPVTLREIGRLRELAFRDAGEGTGRVRDLDRFDDTYEQIVLWDLRERRIAGGYRIAAAERLVRSGGARALYSHTLFDFDGAFLEGVLPGLELGRSFVAPGYQRQPAALFLLWKAIGARVVRDLEPRWLFGPVSISAEYGHESRLLMAAWLRQHVPAGALAPRVRPRTPPRGLEDPCLAVRAAALPSVEALDAAVRALEGGERGVPVLLRHYLGLGARAVAFNVDAAFADVLDCLLVVDLLAVPGSLARRYLGDTGQAELAAALHRRSVALAATG
jgi:hypothetical protein